jgi:hypothetical protein
MKCSPEKHAVIHKLRMTISGHRTKSSIIRLPKHRRPARDDPAEARRDQVG